MLDWRGAVLIAGPTASGKSALALDLAARLGGLIVNADSMQVYRDLRILTARPTPQEEAQAPHRLYGHVDGAVNFSVGHYLRDAAAVLAEARAARRLPIFVGGTGLYFKALVEGLSDIPAVPEAVRERVRAAAEGRDSEALHAELAGRDPATALRLRPSDRLRILRALEVVEATGQSLPPSRGAAGRGSSAMPRACACFWRRNATRCAGASTLASSRWSTGGAIEEVRALATRRLDPMLPAMRAHGVPGLLAHLRGEISLEQAIARGQGDTRRYAKRQFTWFRHQMPGWTAVLPEAAPAALDDLIRSFGT